MFLPIGDENIKGGSKPFFSYTFILINIAVFLFQFLLTSESCRVFIYTYGVIPLEIANGTDYFSLITNMFLHASWMHLIGNMLFLWIFADNIEAIIGNINFFLFFILSGIIAALSHILFNIDSVIPAVGASGAISAIMGAYLVMFPKSKIRLSFLLLKSFNIPAYLFLGIWFLQQMIYGVGSLGTASAQTSGIAWWSHIGGFVFGIFAGLIANRSYLKPSRV